MASLFVKYGPSSTRFSVPWVFVSLAAIFDGPSLAPGNTITDVPDKERSRQSHRLSQLLVDVEDGNQVPS